MTLYDTLNTLKNRLGHWLAREGGRWRVSRAGLRPVLLLERVGEVPSTHLWVENWRALA